MAKINRESVAVAFAGAYDAKDNTGDLLSGALNALQSLYRGKPVPDTDAEFIADEVARQRHWTESSAKPRKSEMRSVIAQYAMLPETIKAARAVASKNDKPLSFSVVVKLARALNKGMSAPEAVKSAFKTAKPVKPEDRDEESAIASTSTHVKRILEHTALNRKFRSQLRDLCEEFGIALA